MLAGVVGRLLLHGRHAGLRHLRQVRGALHRPHRGALRRGGPLAHAGGCQALAGEHLYDTGNEGDYFNISYIYIEEIFRFTLIIYPLNQ